MIFNQNIKKSFGILRESAGLIGLYVVVFALRKTKKESYCNANELSDKV